MLRYNEIDKHKIALFFVYPFAAFLLALQNLGSRSSFVVFFLFNILFGYTFIAQDITSDSFRYVEEFVAMKNMQSEDYYDLVSQYFTFNSDVKDVYVITCNYLVSRVTDNYHVIMALYAIVFSFFFLKSFRFFVDKSEYKNDLYGYLLAFLFVYSNPIYNINGVRFWTAAWIAVYIIFEFLINKNSRILVLAFIVPLVHISFVSYVFVLLFYVAFPKLDRFLVVIFFISIFVGNISFGLVELFKDFLPKAIQNILWAYADEGNLEERVSLIEALPVYAKILKSLPYYYINILMVFFIYNSKVIKDKSRDYSVYHFLLVWLSFVNITMSIPSFGGRFIYLSIPFIAYLCLVFYRESAVFRRILYMIPVVYAYSVLYWFRNMLKVIDPYLLVSVFPHLLIKNLY